ncbi:MAG TPA: DUF4105 domain-containing protein [Polyangia bacterium]|nr:DUF4105 domain-containing protein [Polyangia bacterium]
MDRRGSVFVVVWAALWLAALPSRAAPGAPGPGPAVAPPTLPTLLQRARSIRLPETRDWQVLLHYRRTRFGGWKSEADGPGFFFAGEAGKTSPAAELEATLAAFFQPAVADPLNPQTMHPQCRFPARYAWLKRELAIDGPGEGGAPAAAQLIDQPCPLLDTWRTGISAEAVTLVYATAFLNSPASMYGHTFLRVSRATGEGNPLLDYVINFAADVDTRNGLVYAVRGLTGSFPGRFFVMPYYVKVQEYSNMESRDLWEYELSFSREQVQRMVLHAWETRTTYFDYFFFDENCSYELLTLLEVADPSLHLVERFGGRVVPADTIRVVLDQPGLVRHRAARPSLASTMTERKARLDWREVRAAEAWVDQPADAAPPDLTGVSAARQAHVLDAAYDYLRYREGFKSAEPSDDFKKHERRLLLARGRLGVPPQEIAARSAIDAPERGHATLRLAVGGGFSDAPGSFETLSIRGTLHDFLDPSGGYSDNAHLEMGHLRGRFDNQSRRLRLDRVDLLHIVSAEPVDRWVHSISWKAWLGAENARELGCERRDSDRRGWRCLYAGGTVGGGVAARFGPQRRLLTFALGESDAGAGPAFAAGDNFRVGVGGEGGLIGDAGPLWRFQIGARYIYYLLGETRPSFRTTVAQSFGIGRGLALRFSVETANTYAQASTELVGYF